jgi:hypothetical protein
MIKKLTSLPIVGIVGWAGAGKDTLANFFTMHGWKKDSFAASLKDATASIFGWPRQLLEGDTEESRMFRETVDEFWSTKLDRLITPRIILQEMGTDVMRNNFHQDIWLNTVEKRIVSRIHPTVLSDCRFANELQLVKDLGGVIVYIQRGPSPIWHNVGVQAALGDNEAIEKMTHEYKVHASEWSWLAVKPDYVIFNNETPASLRHQADQLVLGWQQSLEP